MRARGWFRRAPGDRGLAALLRGTVGLSAAAFLVSLAVGPLSGEAGRILAGVGVAVLLSAPFLTTLSAGVSHGRRGRTLDALLAGLLLAALLAGVCLGAA